MTKTVTKPLKRADMDPQWVQVQPLIKHSWSELRGLLHSVYEFLPTSDVLSWCKKRESAAEKLIRKGYSSYSQIGDLVKGVILTDNLDEAVKVATYLITHFNVIKWEAKLGNEENPYCGAIHVDLKLGSLICEIQVMPRSTWVTKKKSNHFYKTGKASEGAHLWASVENFTQAQRELLKA